MSNSNTRGFTIIELMLVPLILTLLFFVAIPAYRDAMQFKQVVEGVRLSEGWKQAVGKYRRDEGHWPPADANLKSGLAVSLTGEFAHSVRLLEGGAIEVTFDGPRASPPIQNSTLDLEPFANVRGEVLWRCAVAPDHRGTPVPAALWPQRCEAH